MIVILLLKNTPKTMIENIELYKETIIRTNHNYLHFAPSQSKLKTIRHLKWIS